MASFGGPFVPYSSVTSRLHCYVLEERWRTVSLQLWKHEDIDDSTREWAMLETCKYASKTDIQLKFKLFFTCVTLENGIKFLLARGRTDTVFYFLKTGNLSNSRKDAFVEDDMENLRVQELFSNIPFHHCLNKKILDSLLQTERWREVQHILSKGKLWIECRHKIYREVLKHADEIDMLRFIVDILNDSYFSHCNENEETVAAAAANDDHDLYEETENLNQVLNTLVKRGMRGYVGKILAMNTRNHNFTGRLQ
jgi:hypothetical protein